MPQSAAGPFAAFLFCATLVAGVGTPGSAQAQDRYAAYVVDLETQQVLHADNADAIRYPASLTKMMTLYMLFEALERGDVSMSTALPVSRNASRQPPSRLGVRRGQSIRVADAIEALAARSANDVAVVVAEHLAGSEARFAERMTARARALGMQDTVFANASGLPDRRHQTTARDMAVLSEALIENFPQYYHVFQIPGMSWRGQYGRNHNRLLQTVEGVDGIKTGYTRWSGYNLATSASRDGRRIVAVVLGGQTSAGRNSEMEHLVEAAYEELRRRQADEAGGAVAARPAVRIAPVQWSDTGVWLAEAAQAEGEGADAETGGDEGWVAAEPEADAPWAAAGPEVSDAVSEEAAP